MGVDVDEPGQNGLTGKIDLVLTAQVADGGDESVLDFDIRFDFLKILVNDKRVFDNQCASVLNQGFNMISMTGTATSGLTTGRWKVTAFFFSSTS